MHCPESGLDKFEEISYLNKHKDSIDMNEFLNIVEDRYYSKPGAEQALAISSFIEKVKKYYDVSDNK